MIQKLKIAVFSFMLLSQIVQGRQNPSNYNIIKGTVVDGTTNEPIAGVNIALIGSALGASTDTAGKFSIPKVPLGLHSLRASALGYTPYIITDIVVEMARPAELNIRLLESAIEMQVVQVTASFFQTIPDKPLSNLIQSNEEIRRLPGGYEDVVRAISILPGVAQVQPGRNDLIVRGGAPSENLFIIDNIELPNINHFGTQGASGGPLSFVNLDFVERTSFSTGGFGVRYGDKLSSVLTIDLRDGRTDRFGGKATISASQFGLNLEGPIDEHGTIVFSARRSYLDFIFKSSGFGFVPEYWDFLARLSYHLSPKDQLMVVAIAALDNVKLFNDTPDKRYNNSRVLGSNQNQAVGGVTWKHIMNQGFAELTVGQSYVDYDYFQNDSLLNPIFKNMSYEHESTFRGDMITHLAKTTELSIGIQTKMVRFYSDLDLVNQRTPFGDTIGLKAVYKTMATKSSAYAQISEEVGLARLTLGGRIDYFDLIEDKFVFSPRFSATYELTPVFNVSASVGTYHQAPSTIWLIANPVNRNLKFVAVNQVVAGLGYLIYPDTKVSVELYTKNYSDYPASLTRPYLVLANTGAGFGGSEEGFSSFGFDPLVSAGTGKARGIELLVQKKLSEIPCYSTISISYNKTEFKAIDGILRPSSFDQRWILNLGGGYILNEKWELSAKFRYVTGRPYTPYGPDGTKLADYYNTLRVDANHSLDIRVDRRWSFEQWSLDTYIDIQNIYNKKPIDVPRYNERTGLVEQTSAIGILPSIGISAEF